MAIVVVLLTVLAGCGDGDLTTSVRVEASIDGTPISASGPGDPQRLDPLTESELALTLTNVSDAAVSVGHARLEGEMLGLTFLTYDTRVLIELAPGETRDIVVPLDFFDLEKQAHGYLRTWLRVYDDDRTRLSSDEFVLDVRGNVLSTMSLFAIVLFLLTAASLAHNLWALRRDMLPPNRFTRGLRFAVTGLGVGLLLSVAFSVLRIFPLPTAGWLPLTIVPTLIGFAVGYVLPGATEVDVAGDDDDAIDLADELTQLGRQTSA